MNQLNWLAYLFMTTHKYSYYYRSNLHLNSTERILYLNVSFVWLDPCMVSSFAVNKTSCWDLLMELKCLDCFQNFWKSKNDYKQSNVTVFWPDSSIIIIFQIGNRFFEWRNSLFYLGKLFDRFFVLEFLEFKVIRSAKLARSLKKYFETVKSFFSNLIRLVSSFP